MSAIKKGEFSTITEQVLAHPRGQLILLCIPTRKFLKFPQLHSHKDAISNHVFFFQALQELLTSDPFQSLQSIIVYCTRRDEAARLASYLRTTLQYQDSTFNVSNFCGF